MPVSLRQIAEEAGVSIGAVSRVLRGDQKFAADTTKRIKRVAAEMGYRPNLLVHSLQAGRTKTIGVMVPPEGEFLARVLCGIHETLATNDYVPMLLWARQSLPELEQIHRLVDRRVDGMILFTTEDTAPDAYLSEIWERDLPTVTVDRRMARTHADFVGTDDFLGGQLAAKHLLGLGHRKLCYLTAKPPISTSIDRWRGFRDVIEQCPGATLTKTVAEGYHEGFGAAKKRLAGSNRPTAVFAANDILAASLMRAAQELGLRVPDDLSVVGFADLMIASATTPSLTTFKQDALSVGNIAAQVVLDRLSGKLSTKKPKVVQLKPELVVRASTTDCPSG